MNTRLFVLPSEILLNERKRNRGRKGKKEGGRERERRRKETRQQWPKAATHFWRTESRWNSSRELKTKY